MPMDSQGCDHGGVAKFPDLGAREFLGVLTRRPEALGPCGSTLTAGLRRWSTNDLASKDGKS